MANWERKNADTLADAIDKHLKRNTHPTGDEKLLSVIRIALDQAANTVNTSASTLNRHRAAVCAICRGSKLYECNVEEGWSTSCAFINTNTSDYAPL
jgi:hypothetical protein